MIKTILWDVDRTLLDFDAAEPLAAALTPKKGGVGAVTTAVLMAHTVEAAMRKCGLEE